MTRKYLEKYTASFLRHYRELETIKELEPEKYAFYQNRYYREFEAFRQIRNFLSHQAFKATDPVAVSSVVVDSIMAIKRKMDKDALSLASKNIISCKPSSNFLHVLNVMSVNNLSYIPILDSDHTVLGIVSSSDVIDVFAKEGKINAVRIIDDFMPYFTIEKEHSQSYYFIGRKEAAYKVANLFGSLSESKHRYGLVLVTENGKKNEALIGVISPSDVLRKQILRY